MSMRKTTLAPGKLLSSVHMEKSYLVKAVTRCCTTGNPSLEIAPGQRKTHMNGYRRQTVHRGKVDPVVSELPRDHVNRPLTLRVIRQLKYRLKMIIQTECFRESSCKHAEQLCL